MRGLRSLPGVSVHSLAAAGDGVPDLLVGYQGRNYLIEVKNPAKPPSVRKLTPEQLKFHAAWRGQVAVVLTLTDAMQVIGWG